MIHFAEPWWLISLGLLPMGWLLIGQAARRRQAHFARLADEGFADRLGVGPSLELARRREAWLFVAGLSLLGASLSRPQLGYTTELQRSEGSDLVVALDLSRSMLAEDLAPSRLERAKIEIRQLLEALAGDRLGLVGFTTVAKPLSPLTTDGRHVALQLERIQPESLPSGGTSIGAGIEGALRLLERTADGDTRAERAIVVFTDGEDHAADGQAQARTALEKGIRVHVVGLGSDEGEPIPLLRDGRRAGYVKDAMGRTVLTRLEPEGIRTVAEAGGGVAVVQEPGRGLAMGPLRKAVEEMRGVEREAKRSRRIYNERYRWFLAPGLLLLGAAAWLRFGAILLLVLVMEPGPSAAQALDPSPAESGNEAPPLLRRWVPELASARRALRDGAPNAALKDYEAAALRLGTRPEVLLGRGLARIQAQKKTESEVQAPSSDPTPPTLPPEALRDLQQASERARTPGLRARALTSFGNALRLSGDLDAAIEAYKEALRTDPDNEDARKNLALSQALRRIEQPPPSPEQGQSEQEQESQGDEEGNEGESQQEEEDSSSESDAESESESESESDSELQKDQGAGDDESAQEDAQKEQAGASGEEGQDESAKPGAEGREAEESEAIPEGEDAAARILRSLEQKEQELQRKRLLKRLQAPRVRKPW
ncbi:MAG: VWA domain-containing protein [Myxococcota bacterium]